MRILTVCSIFLLTAFMFVNSSAQEVPLVFDVENTGADAPKPYLPLFNELPTVTNLPDPFEWSDGRGRIANFSDWQYRRAEIKAEIENYEIGTKPPRPDSIEASYADGVLTVIVTKNGKTLTLSSQIILPEGDGPFPAIIGMNSPSGSLPADIFSSRNIARITFNHNQVTTYSNPQNSNPYYQLYPEFNVTNTGQYSAWAWGVSRIIDGLELVQADLPIDVKHLAVTGCSYAGKMAIFAGAFDERIALTIGVESGGGGYTTWRYSQEIDKTTSVETLSKTDYNWFKDAMRDFGSAVPKLPEDHHELLAMVAPRALLVTGNPDFIWLADQSGHVGSNAAKEVWEALGVPDRFGYSIVGGHNHCALPNSQRPEISAFVDKFLLGLDTTTTNVATTPYNTNLAPWITWSTPTLSNGTSYFGKTTLSSPEDFEMGLDTTVTLEWNNLDGAQKYYVQLSTDPSFKIVDMSDSTISETTKTFSGLLEGKKYFWRVRVQSADGLGPWSDVWHLTTTAQLPAAPVLIAATQHETRTDYIILNWMGTNHAEEYLVQVSKVPDFASVYKYATTADTVRTFTGLSEGQKYYWRVQAKNIAGSGPFSEGWPFTILLVPTDLNLQLNASNEVTLTWVDNSKVEHGYVIQRKQSPEVSFTVLDTIAAASTQFVDNTVVQGQTYTYRVQAYRDSAGSGFSNEATLTVVVGVEEETGIPTEYSLSQNYPNPFNPATKIKFALPQTAFTKVIIYDLLGREVRTLINKELSAGYHEINVEANNFTSGVYFYRIQSGDFVQTKKMILQK